MLLLMLLVATAADPRAVLAGTWKGESTCTPVRPACRDEIAVYHITLSPKKDEVTMMMNKVVNGQEVEMGGAVDYKVNDDATSLLAEYAFKGNHLRWSFTRTGNDMRGTLVDVPSRAVIRNIRVRKQ